MRSGEIKMEFSRDADRRRRRFWTTAILKLCAQCSRRRGTKAAASRHKSPTRNSSGKFPPSLTEREIYTCINICTERKGEIESSIHNIEPRKRIGSSGLHVRAPGGGGTATRKVARGRDGKTRIKITDLWGELLEASESLSLLVLERLWINNG